MKIYVNNLETEVAEGVTLLAVLGERGATEGVAVAVDGTVVPRARWAAFELRDGARLVIVHAVCGG